MDFYVLRWVIFIKFFFQQKICRNPSIITTNYSKGNLLIVPLRGKGDIGILNKQGCIKKIFSTKKPTFYGEFNQIGELVVIHMISNENLLSKNHIYGTTGLINIYDRNSMEVTKSFQNATLHHDIAIQNSKFIFALSWSVKNYNTRNKTIKIVDDSIIQINLNDRKIINRWTLSDYLSVSEGLDYSLPQGEDRLYNIFHANFYRLHTKKSY